jgi:hypothetical protein
MADQSRAYRLQEDRGARTGSRSAMIRVCSLCGGNESTALSPSGYAGTWSSTAPNVRTRAHPGVAGVGGDRRP